MSAKSDRRKCPVTGCDAVIAPSMAMCRACWYLLPQKQKKSVHHEARHHPGSDTHLAAIQTAVKAVEKARARI